MAALDAYAAFSLYWRHGHVPSHHPWFHANAAPGPGQQV